MIYALIILAVLAVLVLTVTYIAYRMAFHVPKSYVENIYELPPGGQYLKYKEKTFEMIREVEQVPFERVETVARDGIRLSARYYHVRDGAPLQIQMHGYRASALRDFCGGNKLARQAGFNVLLIDQRGLGQSGGHTITFGIKERYDCLCWIEYLLERFGPDSRILLSGISMGAATALMASELDLPDNVVGIMADCPFSDPGEIIRKVTRDMGLPDRLLFPFIRLGARLFGGFDLTQANARSAVSHTDIPILLIHGEADKFVPCEMSREIFAACRGKATLKTFPHAGHGISYMVDYEGYKRTVEQFLWECMELERE